MHLGRTCKQFNEELQSCNKLKFLSYLFVGPSTALWARLSYKTKIISLPF